MSLIIVGYSFHGIVITSDKRITTTRKINTDGEHERYEIFPLTDTETKSFVFPHGVSISYCGQSSIRGLPVSFIIKRFIRKCKLTNPYEIANTFLWYIKDLDFSANISIFVCGYSGNDQVVLEGHTNTEKLKNHVISSKPSGLSWMGMKDITSSLINNNIVDFNSLSLQDYIDLSVFLIQTTAKMMKFSATAKTVSENYDCLIITPDGHKWLTNNDYYV